MKSSLKHKCIRLWPVLLLLCPALLLLQTGLHLFAGDYERALHTLMHDLQRPDLEPVLRTRYFNVRLYPYLKTTVFNLPFVCMAAAIYLSYKYENRVVQAWQGIQQLIEKIREAYNVLTSLSRWQQGLLWAGFFALILRSCYLSTIFSLQFDEAWNDLFFLRTPWYVSLTASNNYPLHNLISHGIVAVFGHHPLALRACGILSGLALAAFLFLASFRATHQYWISLGGTIIALSLPLPIFYMLYARGVLLEVFFVMLICYCLLRFIQQAPRKQDVILLAVLHALGTMSMITHVCFWLCTVIFLALMSAGGGSVTLRRWLQYTCLSAAACGIVLLPQALGSGLLAWHALHISSIQWPDIGQILCLSKLSFFITGNSYVLITCIAINYSMWVTMKRLPAEMKATVLLSLVLHGGMVLLLFFTGNSIPERALSFMYWIPVSTMFMVLTLLSRWGLLDVWIGVLCFPVGWFFESSACHHPFLNWSAALDHEVQHTGEILYLHGIHRVYNDSRDFDYFIPGISEYYATKNDTILFTSSAPGSTRYMAARPALCELEIKQVDTPSADTCSGKELYRYGAIRMLEPDRSHPR